MQFIHKKPWLLVFLFMAVTIAFVCKICPAYDANRQEALLNDRASDIIGATPLYTGFVPAVPGLSGQGQTIGIADSGLDKGSLSDIHPDLQSEKGKRPRVAMLKSYAGREVPDDPIGHGTHMAATIVGSGKASEGKYRGIAPEATLYFQALLDNQGELKVPANINTLFEPAYEAGVRVHVNAWGGRLNTYSSRSSQIDRFVYQHPDFLPIFGAGNDGPGKGSLTAEANSKNVLTVGSSQVPRPAFSPEARDAQMIADSSSRGPAADGRIKPELLAPRSVTGDITRVTLIPGVSLPKKATSPEL
jgi:subtilisin family serine protease